jgi:parallel beta-helix repeat protein
MTVTGPTVSNNSGYGIYVTRATSPIVTSNTESANHSGTLHHGSSSGIYSPNTIS